MNFQALFLLCVCFAKTLCSNSLYDISDEDYYKLPELFVLDHYEKCLSQKDTVFCVGTFELQAPQPSQVYDTLKKLSQHTLVNFNHTKLYRGKCLGSIGKCPINETLSLEKSFENCIDRDISKEYGLRAHLSNFDYCKNREDKRKIDSIDRVFLLYISTIILLNFIGTIYDISRKDRSKDNVWLLAFSLQENWRKLTNVVVTAGENVSCFDGMKAILTVLVHIAHTIMALVIGFLPNPRYLEMIGDRPELVLFFNGTLLIQTFIVITSFLRTLKTFGKAERSKLGYKAIAEATLERYVRISPVFITAVGLSATLIPHLGDGPLWKKHVEGEAELCRSTFWRQFFLLQNFYPPSCHPQAWPGMFSLWFMVMSDCGGTLYCTWPDTPWPVLSVVSSNFTIRRRYIQREIVFCTLRYLSVDFQVYLITTIITVYLVRRKDDIPKVLTGLLAASLVLLFTVVHFLGLKPALQIMNPENLLTSFKFEKSFHLLYQSLWGNLPSAIIGMILACIYMKIKSSKYNLKNNKLFVLAYKLAIPVMVSYAAIGIWLLFSMTSPVAVSLYATIDKPLFAATVGVIVLGCIFKVDDTYRNFFEWRGWVVLSRLSLSALLMHVIVNRVLVSNRLYPLNASVANMMADGLGVSAMTFIFSVPLCLMIEYPFIQVYKIIRYQSRPIVANGNSKTKDN